MAKLAVLFSFTVKYKLPSALFSSHVRLNNLWSALEGFPAEGLEVPEACGLHPSPEVSQSTACLTYKCLFPLWYSKAHEERLATLGIGIREEAASSSSQRVGLAIQQPWIRIFCEKFTIER